MSLIDYRELMTAYPKGEGLERLADAIGQRLGLSPTYTGRGADGGRDLTFSEIHQGPVTERMVKWLVSCKDHSVSGSAVTEPEVAGVRDKLDQHQCHGFLLITTTQVGVAAKALLDGVQEKSHGTRLTKVWNSSWLDAFLLKEENHDLLRQFFPESYKKVRGLTSLEGVLGAFGDELPSDVMAEVRRLVEPFSKHSLRGSRIWPGDPAIGAQIDRIVTALLINDDVEEAVTGSEGIDVAALTRLIDAMKDPYPDDAVAYAEALINGTEDTSLAFNVLRSVSEEAGPLVERLDLLAKLDQDGLEYFLWDAVQEHIEQEVYNNSDPVNVHNEVITLAHSAEIDEVYIDSITFEQGDESIRFSGNMSVAFTLYFDREDEGGLAQYFPGTFEGVIEEDGITLEGARVDTSDYGADFNDEETDDVPE